MWCPYSDLSVFLLSSLTDIVFSEYYVSVQVYPNGRSVSYITVKSLSMDGGKPSTLRAAFGLILGPISCEFLLSFWES